MDVKDEKLEVKSEGENLSDATPDVNKEEVLQEEKIVFEEEIILPNEDQSTNDIKDWRTENQISMSNGKLSPLLNTEDFELVILKDDIDLNNTKDENIRFETLNIPNNTHGEFLKFVDADGELNALERLKRDPKNIPNVLKLSEESKLRESRGVTATEDNTTYFSKATLNRDDGEQVIMHPSFINTRRKSNSSSLLDNISKATNTEVVISVPLYNSGIWIGIQSPSEPEIIQLQMLALENEIKLGASTAGLVYSNYSVIFAKHALDLAFSNIKYSSVKVDNFSALRELIDITDENAILNGLAAAMYPTGVDRMITCSNFLDTKKPCNHTIQAKLHFDRMLYPDYSRLTDDLLLHMAKKTPNSTTIAEVEKYQKQLSKYRETTRSYKMPNGEDLTIRYKTPNIKNAIIQGEYWVEKITKVVNDIITGSNKNTQDISDEMMKIYIDSAMRTNLLGLYLHFIDSISMNGEEETDYTKINNMLPALTKVDNIANEIISDILVLIKNASITIIGHTQYTCPNPKCKKVNNNDTVEDGHPFKKIIPFNVLGVLFILGNLKYSTIILRKE